MQARGYWLQQSQEEITSCLSFVIQSNPTQMVCQIRLNQRTHPVSLPVALPNVPLGCFGGTVQCVLPPQLLNPSDFSVMQLGIAAWIVF